VLYISEFIKYSKPARIWKEKMTIVEKIFCRFGFHGKLERTNFCWENYSGTKLMDKGALLCCTICGRYIPE
jgi:hypothetical protein